MKSICRLVLELSVMMGRLYVCTVQCRNRAPPVATEHLDVATATEELNFKYIIFELI